MKRSYVSVLAAVALLGFSVSTPASAGTDDVRDVCGTAAPGQVRCLAEVRTDVHGGSGLRGPLAGLALPAGYGPADLAAAYRTPATGGTGQTVAIVDAGDDPNAETDLAVYRSTYGLPPCTTANGCFRKVNQAGAASPLPPNEGWGIEIALDLDMVSAACPSCHILLVGADTPDVGDMATAVDTAAALGADEISNSYGTPENGTVARYAAHYRHPGVAVVASSGDSGYDVPSMPAAYDSVIAVGGTALSRANNTRGWTEEVWNSGRGRAAGSGCSAWVDKPSWQHDPNCPGRMTADVAAVADPRTGVAVYQTAAGHGWLVTGGTSASAPYVAGLIGLAGDPDRYPNASALYGRTAGLNDVVGGDNVDLDVGWHADCGGDYQCTAVVGYDGPTGNGTPNGPAAF